MLLDRFPDDDDVASSLWGEFISGGWMGPESEMLAAKIGQLEAWRKDASEPPGVRKWAKKTSEYAQNMRAAALEREAEGDF